MSCDRSGVCATERSDLRAKLAMAQREQEKTAQQLGEAKKEIESLRLDNTHLAAQHQGHTWQERRVIEARKNVRKHIAEKLANIYPTADSYSQALQDSLVRESKWSGTLKATPVGVLLSIQAAVFIALLIACAMVPYTTGQQVAGLILWELCAVSSWMGAVSLRRNWVEALFDKLDLNNDN